VCTASVCSFYITKYNPAYIEYQPSSLDTLLFVYHIKYNIKTNKNMMQVNKLTFTMSRFYMHEKLEEL